MVKYNSSDGIKENLKGDAFIKRDGVVVFGWKI